MTKETVTVSKKDLVAEIAEKHELTKKLSNEIVTDLFASISNHVAQGHVVRTELGKWEVRENAERKGRNPQNGKELVIAASVKPAFKASKQFKEAVKGQA